MIVYLFYSWINVIFCFIPVFDDMDMDRLMVIRVKLEDETKNNKNSRHSLSFDKDRKSMWHSNNNC